VTKEKLKMTEQPQRERERERERESILSFSVKCPLFYFHFVVATLTWISQIVSFFGDPSGFKVGLLIGRDIFLPFRNYDLSPSLTITILITPTCYVGFL
jgi:hypothetical protein